MLEEEPSFHYYRELDSFGGIEECIPNPYIDNAHFSHEVLTEADSSPNDSIFEEHNSRYNFFVEVYHKPRGSGGKWLLITQNQGVRVSPKTGKHLRISVQGKCEVDLIRISLIEIVGQSSINKKMEGIQIVKKLSSVDPKNPEIISSQIDLKLYLSGKQYQFLVQGPSGEKALTVKFSTHNTGKMRQSRKRKTETNLPINPSKKSKVMSNEIGFDPDFFLASVDDEDDSEESPPKGNFETKNDIVIYQHEDRFIHDRTEEKIDRHKSIQYLNQQNSNDNLQQSFINPNNTQIPQKMNPQVNYGHNPQVPQYHHPVQNTNGGRKPIPRPSVNIKADPLQNYNSPPKHSSPPLNLPHKELMHSTKSIDNATYRSDNSEAPNYNNNKQVLNGDLDVLGVVRARRFYQYSDMRLKTNVEDLIDAISIVNRLQGKRYEWIPGSPVYDESGGKKVIGLIAQEVQQVLPEVVHEDENGILSVNYSELAPIIISAFNEHLQNDKVYKEEIREELLDLKNCIQLISDSNDQNLSKKLEEFNTIVESAKKKLDVYKYPPRKSFINNKKIVSALIAAILLLTGSILALAIILPTANTDKQTPNQLVWSDNALNNPYFDEITGGDNANHWEAYNHGYSLLSQVSNGSYNILGQYVGDPNTKPVPSSDGNVVIRLGSTAQPSGELRYYIAKQFVYKNLTQQVTFSALCNPKETGTNTTTRFYVAISPILSDRVEAAWESRLFYTMGNQNWEKSQKLIYFDAEELSQFIGFSVSIVLITTEPVVFYCDDIRLSILDL